MMGQKLLVPSCTYKLYTNIDSSYTTRKQLYMNYQCFMHLACKMKYFILILISVFFLTNAVEVIDGDINPLLVSYFLDKVKQSESNIICRWIKYQEHYRQITDKPTAKAPVVIQCFCPPTSVAYLINFHYLFIFVLNFHAFS